MKKTFRFALMAVLTVGLSLAVTSCKDDDNSENNGGEPTAEEIAVEHAETFWSVAANLVSPFDVTTDYENKTFEPTIGSPLDGSSTIRVVNCGSMASAASRFTSITGVEIDENTATYTYQDDAVGTLVYTKTDNATSLATIDVNIKQIPHLQQIVFKTSEQMGANGKFSGTAYYSFGDVISLNNEDGLQEYWVCIRPALGPAGKEDTHWATVSPLPKKNVWNYHGKKKDIEFNLPTQLGEDFDQMQNLAELLYAVCNPDQWWENLQQNPKVDLFGDLYHERAQYFNQYFWLIVQRFWSDKSAGESISEKLFGYEFEDMKKIINDQNALHLLYRGFSWYTKSSNSPTLYEYTFSNGTGKKSNMHSYKSKSVSKNVMTGDGIKLDCVGDYDNHWICPAFFGDEQPHFIFRFATGKELFGSQPGVFQSMKGTKRNIRDVYVLNEQLGIKTQSDLKVFTEDDTVDPNELEPAIGKIIGKNGRFYETVEDAKNISGQAVAMVVYLGGENRVENDKDWNGLAMALDDVTAAEWLDDESKTGECPLKGYSVHDEAHFYDFAGIANTETLVAGCNHGHNHAIAKLCANYSVAVPTGGNFSKWFLPSFGQARLAHLALGGKYEVDTLVGSMTKGEMIFTEASQDIFTMAGVKSLWEKYFEPFRWTSTKYNKAGKAVLWCRNFAVDRLENANEVTLRKTAIPFIAFKYGDGGTKNIKDEHVAKPDPDDDNPDPDPDPDDDDEDDDDNPIPGGDEDDDEDDF